MAGIIDGESCLHMRFQKQPKSMHSINVRFQLQACDYSMIERFGNLLSALKIEYKTNIKTKTQKANHRKSYILEINKKEDNLKLTRIFKDKLVVKNHECILINEYLERACKKNKYSPSSRDREIVRLVKALKS